MDIATELGISAGTVTRNLERYGIPVRPAGVHSRTEMVATADKSLSADIRRAVEGTLHGWQRLQRFQTAMAFPTIEAAADHLGAHQAALVRQFQRLEQDIGTQLFRRTTPTQPMRPTRRGNALLRALDQPHVRHRPNQPRKPAHHPG
ncbi:LysR family transcriptional regulator [Kutzneria viridogrisea]